MHTRKIVSLFGFGVALLAGASAFGVIINGSATRNTSAPTGSLANSGWQYEGKFGSFLGTAIGSNYFITASHIGGSVGQAFTYNGKSYSTTAMYDDPNSDLRIWKVSGNLGVFAPLYTSTSEAGKQMLITGRGTGRGDAVTVNGQLKGWKWGASDSVESWGTNTAVGTVYGGSGLGYLLRATFDRSGGYNEGTLSSGDSGGGVFMNDGTGWKLAGINYGVESSFSSGGSTYSAAILDKGGLSGSADYLSDVPTSLYASDISHDMAWIRSVTGSTAYSGVVANAVASVPEPTAVGLAICGLLAGLGGRRHRDGMPRQR